MQQPLLAFVLKSQLSRLSKDQSFLKKASQILLPFQFCLPSNTEWRADLIKSHQIRPHLRLFYGVSTKTRTFNLLATLAILTPLPNKVLCSLGRRDLITRHYTSVLNLTGVSDYSVVRTTYNYIQSHNAEGSTYIRQLVVGDTAFRINWDGQTGGKNVAHMLASTESNSSFGHIYFPIESFSSVVQCDFCLEFSWADKEISTEAPPVGGRRTKVGGVANSNVLENPRRVRGICVCTQSRYTFSLHWICHS